MCRSASFRATPSKDGTKPCPSLILTCASKQQAHHEWPVGTVTGECSTSSHALQVMCALRRGLTMPAVSPSRAHCRTTSGFKCRRAVPKACRQTGHCPNMSSFHQQLWQNEWPQGVVTGFLSVSKQIGHAAFACTKSSMSDLPHCGGMVSP